MFYLSYIVTNIGGSQIKFNLTVLKDYDRIILNLINLLRILFSWKSGVNALKISTQGRYGLRALVDLVVNESSGSAIPLREISERQEISERYLEQLFAKLRKAGIVNSVRGAHGGYKLNRSPEELTIGDIIRTLEGDLAPTECTMEKDNTCKFEAECVTHEVWEKIKEQIEKVIDSITLADLKERSLEIKAKNNDNYIYHI